MGTPSPQSGELALPAKTLVAALSYSHFELLTAIDDPLKRAFYEIESVHGAWSIRELKRQIASLYYERSGLSRDKKKLAKTIAGRVEHSTTALTIRDPNVFEFLGVRPDEVMPESQLEHALLDKLEAFLLELVTSRGCAPVSFELPLPGLEAGGARPAANSGVAGAARARAESRAESAALPIEGRVVAALTDGPLSKSQVASKLGLKGVTGQLNRAITSLLKRGTVEATIPEKKASRLQKYRLAAKKEP